MPVFERAKMIEVFTVVAGPTKNTGLPGIDIGHQFPPTRICTGRCHTWHIGEYDIADVDVELTKKSSGHFMGHIMGAKNCVTTAKFSLQYKSES